MSLTIFNGTDNSFNLMETSWAAQLNPLLANPANLSVLVKNVKLVTGSNTINTTLGRNLQGWTIIRQRAAGTVYDNQDNNPNPSLTLILIASAPMVVDLEIY